jgi:hypothetical protein
MDILSDRRKNLGFSIEIFGKKENQERLPPTF